MKKQDPQKEKETPLEQAAEASSEPENLPDSPASGGASELKQRSGLSEARKRALVNYMAVLFAVAFLLVALSLGSQYRDSQATISQLGASANTAMEKADKLQEENRQLQQKLKEAQDALDVLSEQLADAETSLTDAENQEGLLSGANQELLQEKLDLEKRLEACRLLVRAQNALSKGNTQAFQAAMTELAEVSDLLSISDQSIYKELLNSLNP